MCRLGMSGAVAKVCDAYLPLVAVDIHRPVPFIYIYAVRTVEQVSGECSYPELLQEQRQCHPQECQRKAPENSSKSPTILRISRTLFPGIPNWKRLMLLISLKLLFAGG
jgi:hypothetical protein